MRLPWVDGRAFEIASLAVIVASLVAMTVDTLPDLSAETRRWVRVLEIATVAIYTVEYALRVWAHRGYAKSGWGAVDALAILPFYLALAVAWTFDGSQAIRALRLVRVFRVARFGKVGDTVDALAVALGRVRTEIVVATGGSVLMMYVSSMLVYYAERSAQPELFASVFHAMWWSVATLTTVGYGDVYPVTAGGKVFAVLTMIFGIGMFGAVAGIMTSVMFSVTEQLKAGTRNDRRVQQTVEHEDFSRRP